ncbi:hypothetical protein TNCT_240271 [Trichonephila clavata]|uniref:Uncharacterized protein n=1 Tax=Trichonephila clavata TaxID=2740835 RepID=A0A8X6FV19_TRICU|nr:hypothetical protein TNCT_240271 [Trichonephila clavata]
MENGILPCPGVSKLENPIPLEDSNGNSDCTLCKTGKEDSSFFYPGINRISKIGNVWKLTEYAGNAAYNIRCFIIGPESSYRNVTLMLSASSANTVLQLAENGGV